MIARMKDNTKPTQAQLHITRLHDTNIALINDAYDSNTLSQQEYVNAIEREMNEYNRLMKAKQLYIAKDFITRDFIFKGSVSESPMLTSYEKYASVFTSKASAYKYAWQVFAIHKKDLIVIAL